MFWLPITLALILIVEQLVFHRAFAISFDLSILFNTLEDDMWRKAPTDIQTTIHHCGQALKHFGRLSLISCIVLMLLSFSIIMNYHADPYQSSIVMLLCAIDTYGYFFLFRRLFVKCYAHYQYPQLKPAIHYLLTFPR